MIKNYIKFNEGIKHLLVGPTVKDVLSNMMKGKLKGFIKSVPDSPEDFFNQMKEGCIEMSGNKYFKYYGKNDSNLFMLDSKNEFLGVSINKIWSVLENIYGLNDNEIEYLIRSQLKEDINLNSIIPNLNSLKITVSLIK